MQLDPINEDILGARTAEIVAPKSRLPEWVDREIVAPYRSSRAYLAHVWSQTHAYFTPYPVGVQPTLKQMLSMYWLLFWRAAFLLFAVYGSWTLMSATVTSYRRSFGGGPVARYEVLLNKCERNLFLHSRACGLVVSEGDHSMLCVWDDPGHTRLSAYLNPKIVLNQLDRLSVAEYQVGCDYSPQTTKMRGSSVIVYYDSAISPGTTAARLYDDPPTAFCVQHAIEFPLGSPCAK